MSIRAKLLEVAVRVRHGDLGVNQSAEVGGLIGVAVGVTGAIVANSEDLGETVTNFFTDAFGN